MHLSLSRAACALLLVASCDAISQTESTDGQSIDEIVVAGALQERPLSELPVSIAVIDRQAIEDSIATHFEQLSLQVANLNFAGGSNRAR
ncbi:MAG: hypothetical protein AAFU66_05475, partial [Pseudomonadota bacterium]